MTIGEKIAILRKARGFSQEQLGLSLATEQMGVSRQSVSDWENGRSEPKLENIKAIAKLLDVSYDALLDENIDLNDPETLSKVISRTLSTTKENRTGYSIDYRIHKYLSFKKLSLKTIITSFCLLIFGVPSLIHGIMFIDSADALPIILLSIGTILITFFVAEITLLAIKIKIWLSSKSGEEIARLTYRDLTIYPDKNDPSNRAIFLPVKKIVEIKKTEDDKTHCDIEVIIEEETKRTYIIKNVNNPDRLITIFNDAKDFLKEKETNQEK